ncbi:MAG: TIGR04141 family sporadically distributed protein [Rubrobacter sp.]|nr:TIGR04141 family sporadically distributed protein [Rubrobacter sp.]
MKRHLGSRDLSHLFSQGVLSADLLQMKPNFRSAVRRVIAEVAGTKEEQVGALRSGRNLNLRFRDRVRAIIADWRGRDLAQAMPFFSKINLRRTARDLMSRGFKVACLCVPISSENRIP